jgi:hypothetical protein
MFKDQKLSEKKKVEPGKRKQEGMKNLDHFFENSLSSPSASMSPSNRPETP